MGEQENASGATVPCIALLADLRSRLLARADNAYCEMISVARRDESLGWEIKVERGEFGRKELDAHCKAGELLGRHRALAEACREIDEVLKANSNDNKSRRRHDERRDEEDLQYRSLIEFAKRTRGE